VSGVGTINIIDEDFNWYEGITDHMVSGYKRRYEKGLESIKKKVKF